ncbi:MAG: DUF302 domain-containing protein [Bacteroidetes bacterium]|jgi:uncharacterized protein (DUF302 family)|nr:DUF302 domain-containing protein [Bacteroidota bacterium]
MNYFTTKTIDGEFDAVIAKVTAALKEIGFGIITTIDVKATLKEKIDADFKPYTILGACNPHFAHKALRMEDKLGVILPCNVVVIDQGGGAIEVAAMEPLGMIQMIGNDQLTKLAAEISARIGEVIEAL